MAKAPGVSINLKFSRLEVNYIKNGADELHQAKRCLQAYIRNPQIQIILFSHQGIIDFVFFFFDKFYHIQGYL